MDGFSGSSPCTPASYGSFCMETHSSPKTGFRTLNVVNVVVSQRTEWLEERKRDEGTISHQSRTYNIGLLSLPSYMGRVHSATKKMITIILLRIID